MRILLITSAWPAAAEDPRGSFIHRLATGLSGRGFTVAVVAPGHATAPDTWRQGNLTVHRASYAHPAARQRLAVGLGGIVPNLRRRPWLAAQIPGLVRALRREAAVRAPNSDLVHAHWLFPGGLAGVAAAERASLPLVVTCHGGDINLARRLPPLAWWSRPVLARADRLTAVSHAMRRGLIALGADPERVQFLPLGVAVPAEKPPNSMPASWHAFRAAPGLRVLFAGGLSPRKSPGTLLEAIRLLRLDGHPAAAAFIGDGPLRPALERRAADLEHVWIVGDRPPDEVATWMLSCDVLVLPSLAEGRGLVLVEAMACGRAVIASDIPGPDELVHEDRTGLRFPAGDAAALAKRLARFVADPGLAARLGDGGRRLVEAEGLLLEDSLDRHVALYEQVLRRRRVGS